SSWLFGGVTGAAAAPAGRPPPAGSTPPAVAPPVAPAGVAPRLHRQLHHQLHHRRTSGAKWPGGRWSGCWPPSPSLPAASPSSRRSRPGEAVGAGREGPGPVASTVSAGQAGRGVAGGKKRPPRDRSCDEPGEGGRRGSGPDNHNGRTRGCDMTRLTINDLTAV